MKILKKEISNTHIGFKILNKIKALKTIKIVYNIIKNYLGVMIFEYLYSFESYKFRTKHIISILSFKLVNNMTFILFLFNIY